MFVLKLQVGDFVSRAASFTGELKERFKLTFGTYPGEADVNSWRRSLPALATVLAKAPIGVQQAVIHLEFGMPRGRR